MTSGAPLTKRNSRPSIDLWSVAMNLCSDSNGMASIRGNSASSALAVEAEFGRERIERSLGRVALNLPRALLLEQLRVVAQQ